MTPSPFTDTLAVEVATLQAQHPILADALSRAQALLADGRLFPEDDGLCSAITPSPSLWTILFTPRIIVRDHNLVTEGHLGHGTMHKSTPHYVASHWHATHVFG